MRRTLTAALQLPFWCWTTKPKWFASRLSIPSVSHRRNAARDSSSGNAPELAATRGQELHFRRNLRVLRRQQDVKQEDAIVVGGSLGPDDACPAQGTALDEEPQLHLIGQERISRVLSRATKHTETSCSETCLPCTVPPHTSILSLSAGYKTRAPGQSPV